MESHRSGQGRRTSKTQLKGVAPGSQIGLQTTPVAAAGRDLDEAERQAGGTARESHQLAAGRGGDEPGRSKWVSAWGKSCLLLSGLFALGWLILRSGTKPSRLAYPCQQAAIGTATAAFGVPAVAAMLSFRTKLFGLLRTLYGKMVFGGACVTALALLAVAHYEPGYSGTRLSPREGYVPEVFLVNDARGIETGRYGGVDDLFTVMGAYGLKLHQSEMTSKTSGPDGIIASGDVVIIKINYQWPYRGGTNTDVLRGVIRRVIEHPDTFTGEVVVCENAQFRLTEEFDRRYNNAEYYGNSPSDVVASFQAEGHSVSWFDWTTIRTDLYFVAEYSEGDYDSGYVVYSTVDPESGMRLSYPKFQSGSGTYVSYKHGIWSPASQTYDADRLVVINIPVFKTHSGYGITASVKNHMGVITDCIEEEARPHHKTRFGGLGSFLAEVRMPNLNILDCIWIHALLGSDVGPWSSYNQASRRDQLVAGTDPVALDSWATKYIMIPQLVENGYSSYPDQDSDNLSGDFGQYLSNTMNELLLAGIDTTMDYSAVRARLWAGDSDRDGDLDLRDFSVLTTCMTGPDGIVDEACEVFDADLNDLIDLADAAAFQTLFTGAE